MAIYGNLATFPITDLLQWVESARKSGVLSVESNHVTRKVVFRDGRVVACSSNDPPSLLGQVLLARGRITPEILRNSLARQEATGENLGTILVDIGAVTSEEVVRHIAAKAEEALYSLFDWEEAEFEFDESAPPPPNTIEVSLQIQDVLLRGLQRYDEMKRIRQVFHDRDMVLERTDKPVPPKVAGSRVASRILDAINGDRTLAELLLHARTSEYLVSKFLFELHRQGLVRVRETRTDTAEEGVAVSQEIASAAPAEGGVEAVVSGTEEGPGPARDVSVEIEAAQGLLARGEPDAAIALLHATARAFPGMPTVRQLIAKAESAYMDKVSHRINPTHIPVLVETANQDVGEDLPANESYLLTLIDGTSDLKSILWLAPMRKLDVFRAIEGLRSRGIITLRDPTR